jgi:hypothetical protein
MHHEAFRKTLEFRALNAFKSWLYYNYDGYLAVKASKPKPTTTPKPDELKAELSKYTVEVLKKKAKARGLVLPETTRKPELVNVLADKIIADAPKHKSSQQKLASTFKQLRERVEDKRTFKADTMAQLKAKLTEIIQLLETAARDALVNHGK